jgi:hypothetical protein
MAEIREFITTISLVCHQDDAYKTTEKEMWLSPNKPSELWELMCNVCSLSSEWNMMRVYVDDDKFDQSEPCSEAEWKKFVLEIYHKAMSAQNISGSCIISINLYKKPSNSHEDKPMSFVTEQNQSELYNLKYPSEAEYNSILSQLDAFLASPDVDTAFRCITDEKLKSKIEHDTRHSFVSSHKYWNHVVSGIKNAIFYTPGNIFYIKVQTRESPMKYVPPTAKTNNMIRYLLNYGDKYVVDIKKLSSATYVKNIYIYPDGVLNDDGKVNPGPHHSTSAQGPFNLMDNTNSQSVIDGFRLHDVDTVPTCNHILLATDDLNLVLRVEFQFQNTPDTQYEMDMLKEELERTKLELAETKNLPGATTNKGGIGKLEEILSRLARVGE